jgi:hypothetical protein
MLNGRVAAGRCNMVEKNAYSFGSSMSGRQPVRVAFLCLTYGMEEAAKHPMPDARLTFSER